MCDLSVLGTIKCYEVTIKLKLTANKGEYKRQVQNQYPLDVSA